MRKCFPFYEFGPAVLKARSPSGVQRLVDLVSRHRRLAAQELVDEVAREVTSFSRGSAHVDDKVLMVMKVLEDLDPKM